MFCPSPPAAAQACADAPAPTRTAPFHAQREQIAAQREAIARQRAALEAQQSAVVSSGACPPAPGCLFCAAKQGHAACRALHKPHALWCLLCRTKAAKPRPQLASPIFLHRPIALARRAAVIPACQGARPQQPRPRLARVCAPPLSASKLALLARCRLERPHHQQLVPFGQQLVHERGPDCVEPRGHFWRRNVCVHQPVPDGRAPGGGQGHRRRRLRRAGHLAVGAAAPGGARLRGAHSRMLHCAACLC